MKQLAQDVVSTASEAASLPDKTQERFKAEALATTAWAKLLRACTLKFGAANAKRVAIQEVAFC